MKVTYSPITEIIVYEMRQHPLDKFQKKLDDTYIPWCGGYFLGFDHGELQPLIMENLIKNQIFHINTLNYCKFDDYTKEIKNQNGIPIKIRDMTGIEMYEKLVEFIIEFEKSSTNTNAQEVDEE